MGKKVKWLKNKKGEIVGCEINEKLTMEELKKNFFDNWEKEIRDKQYKEIVEKIEDVKGRTLKHKGPNKELDNQLNNFISVVFKEIIRVIKNIKK